MGYHRDQSVPRRTHSSKVSAMLDGYVYGITVSTDDGDRCIMFKPTNKLFLLWADGMGKAGAGDIESIQFDKLYQGDEWTFVTATYMSGIGMKRIGQVRSSDVKKFIDESRTVAINQCIDYVGNL